MKKITNEAQEVAADILCDFIAAYYYENEFDHEHFVKSVMEKYNLEEDPFTRFPYRVYYELWRENGVEKYKKNTGIPLDIASYGRVMLRYRGNCAWNMTDYGTGLSIDHIIVLESEQLYEYTKEHILKVIIPNIMNYPHYRDKIRNAREKARQIPLLRRYLDKEKYLIV